MYSKSVTLVAAVAAVCAGPVKAQSVAANDQSADTAVRGSRFEAVEEVVVTGERTSNYTGETTTATLLPLDIKDTGMSLTVVNDSLLKDLAVTSLNDALAAAGSGTANSPNASTGFTPRMRGFEATVLRNGHRFRRQTFDTYNVDSLEVARGSFGALYGVTDPGGVLNVVTMAPDFRQHFDVIARGGNNQSKRGQINANMPFLNDAVTVKLDAVYDEKEGDIDNWFTEVWGVNPGVRIGLWDDKLVIKGEFEKLENKQTASAHLVAINLNAAGNRAIGYDRTNRGLGLNWNTYGPDSYFKRESQNWFAEASYRIVDNISARFSYANASFDNTQAILLPGAGNLSAGNLRTAQFYRQGQSIYPYYDNTDLNLGSADRNYNSGVFNRSKKFDLVADWNVGIGKLTTLVGWDQFNEETPFCVIARGTALGTQETLSPDAFENIQFNNNPDTAAYSRVACVDPANQFQAYRGSMVFSGWDDRINIVAGARRDYDPQQRDGFRIINGANTAGTPFEAAGQGIKIFRPEDKTTYQYSILFKATDWISPFANYSTSFRPQTATIFPAGADGIFRPKPLEGVGVDFGVKLNLWNGVVDGTISYFDMTLKNRPSTSPGLSGVGTLPTYAGRENVKGVDTQFTIRPMPSLLLLGNATYIDSKVEQYLTTLVDEKGQDVIGVPEWNAFLLMQYTLPMDLQIQGTVEYRGSFRTSASSNTIDFTGLRTDAVTLLGARVSYPLTIGNNTAEVALVGRNLADKIYIVEDGSLNDPRSVLAEVSVSF
jgi:outer membrane receptor protein involved in Fe transport